ncbi:pre-mRNA processing factor 3-domain-containing protein [Dipodascopsis tothii]|uniref:pre-mRNA processing factor 3-domain-containing protein n=1 Tax=Dipodascopsis tothii TaxID=44089 RepID=UPI0034CFF7A3
MADVRKRAYEADEASSSKKQKAEDGVSAIARPLTQSPVPSPTGSGRGSDVLAKAKALARTKAALAAKNVTERLSRERSGSAGGSPAPPAPMSVGGSEALRAQIAERKARIAAAMAATGLDRRAPKTPSEEERERDRERLRDDRGRGGLNVGVHPALLSDALLTSFGKKKEAAKRAKAKKQLDLLAPAAEDDDPSKNPFFDPNIDARPKERAPRTLAFNPRGKYVEQGNALRAQARLEELKKRIQETSKKAGLDDEFDVADIGLRREAPPAVEWWDQGLVTNQTYDDVDGAGLLKIDTDDSPITLYIQHPLPVIPPWEKNNAVVKPPHLTKKELKRIRKTERAERHKEKQDRIRLGLDPAPPPKVKLSNLMSVLTNEAIKDPTLVEARVRREVEERKQKHVQDNLERQLTADERHKKLDKKLAEDEKRALVCAVFRIETLANPQHRYKVNVNAQQHKLLGVTILNSKFNLVVVEGGAKAVKAYKKLMLSRIKWTEAPDPLADDPPPTAGQDPAKSLADNRCDLIWEGELKQHNFKRWSTRTTDNESEVREILNRAQVGNYWVLAKNWKPDVV